MDKGKLTENIGKVSAGDRNQDPAKKANEGETEKHNSEKQESPEPSLL